uniref:Cyanobacterial aminoacyl-tRNA synthetase CAAD domain-containing protein n=1 Tax=Glycine max TaxID=3847 RepID=K7KH62_SOYBN
MSGSAIEAVADYETALTLISQEKLETHRENKYLNNIIYILSLGASESLTEQVAGMASTLSISSSSTLVDAKPPTPRQCVTLPTLPPPPFHSQTRPWKTTAFCRRLARNFMAMATTREAAAAEVAATTDLSIAETPEIVKTIQEAWDKVEDKYAVSSLAVAGVVALVGSAGMISWFAYKNFVFKPDREAFLRKVKETYSEILGSS